MSLRLGEEEFCEVVNIRGLRRSALGDCEAGVVTDESCLRGLKLCSSTVSTRLDLVVAVMQAHIELHMARTHGRADIVVACTTLSSQYEASLLAVGEGLKATEGRMGQIVEERA